METLNKIQNDFKAKVGHKPHSVKQMLAYCKQNNIPCKYRDINKWWPTRYDPEEKPKQKAINADDYKDPNAINTTNNKIPQRLFYLKTAKNIKKLNDASFYKTNVALNNEEIYLYPNINWKQEVKQYSDSYKESLTIQIKGCNKRIDNNNTQIKNDKQLKSMLLKSNNIYINTMNKLFNPYLNGLKPILDIILLYKGQHLLPIRYSIDLLPYFHLSVRQTNARNNIWNESTEQCTIDFIPNQNIILIEDIYDEWVNHIRNKLLLRSEFNEQALFYIPIYDIFMSIDSENNTNTKNVIRAKNIFTQLYIESLHNIVVNNCTDYAFSMDLIGINYYYSVQLQQRTYTSYDWGSRSRCWDGNGFVLLGNGKQKLIKDLCINDEVAVLNELPNKVITDYQTAKVTVKIESIINRKYNMVCVKNKLWITPYHAVLLNNEKGLNWKMPCDLNKIEKKFENSIFNFILDRGHVLCVNGIWACTLGHNLTGNIIENPIWGSSHVMYDYWSKKNGYPNVVEYI